MWGETRLQNRRGRRTKHRTHLISPSASDRATFGKRQAKRQAKYVTSKRVFGLQGVQEEEEGTGSRKRKAHKRQGYHQKKRKNICFSATPGAPPCPNSTPSDLSFYSIDPAHGARNSPRSLPQAHPENRALEALTASQPVPDCLADAAGKG